MSNLICSKEIFSVVCNKVLNSNQIAVGHKNGFITILNFNNNALKKVNTMNCSYTSSVSCIEALEDNRIASSEEKNSQITVWSSQNYNIINKLNGHEGRVTCIKRLKTNQIISCSVDGSIKIWDYEVGKCLETLKGHNKKVYCIDVYNDLIVSGSEDAIKLWDLNDNKCIYTFLNYSSIISSIIFIGNDYIISGSSDSTLRLWNLNTKECEKTFKHNDEIKDVKFISSERFASCSIDGYIKTWDYKSDKCISTEKVENSLNICIDTIFDF
jgi:WD40 repeat protein